MDNTRSIGLVIALTFCLQCNSARKGPPEPEEVRSSDTPEIAKPTPDEQSPKPETLTETEPAPVDIPPVDIPPRESTKKNIDRPDDPKRTDTPTYTIRSLVEYLASDKLDGRVTGSSGNAEARYFLEERLKECGVAPGNGESYFQTFNNLEAVNVIGIVKGTDPRLSERFVLLGAHYDHIKCREICNGADDNASGVAVSLATACEIAQNQVALQRSLIVAFWDAEEPPFFLTDRMGSEAYASSPIFPLDRTELVITLDLVGGELWKGFKGVGLFGFETSRSFLAAIEDVAEIKGLLVLPGSLALIENIQNRIQPWSDYAPFRDRGVPVLFMSTGRTIYYHTPEDKSDTLSYQKMELEKEYLSRFLERLDREDFVERIAPRETVVAELDTEFARKLLEDAISAEVIPADILDDNGVREILREGSQGNRSRRSRVQNARRIVRLMQCLGRTGRNLQECLRVL